MMVVCIVYMVSEYYVSGWVVWVGGDSFGVWLQGLSFVLDGGYLCELIMEVVEVFFFLDVDYEVMFQVFCIIGVGDVIMLVLFSFEIE